MSHRIMMQGEDGALWCEVNNKSYNWCNNNGDELCSKYENAKWWIEQEESSLSRSHFDTGYFEEDYYD